MSIIQCSKCDRFVDSDFEEMTTINGKDLCTDCHDESYNDIKIVVNPIDTGFQLYYEAYDDNTYEAGEPVGIGVRRVDAVKDLLEQIFD